MVAIAVGDIDFACVLVDSGLGGVAELGGVVASLARRNLADLRGELAGEREFQDGVVIVGIAADPDETPLVDLDAVLAPDPLIALAGAAPGAQQIAVGVEFQDRRRRDAALRARRRQWSALPAVGARTAAERRE